MARLILLNGPPAVGKTTLARRWADEHPGTLICEIDLLRTLVAGWETDAVTAGARIRTAALAMITAYLRAGGDVVLPQLLADPAELGRFVQAATSAGAQYVHVLLTAPEEEIVRRFHDRGADHAWGTRTREMVESDGGDEALRTWIARLGELDGVRVPSTDPAATYDALVAALGDVRSSPSGRTSPRPR
jgi:predicted kinase